MLIRKGEGTVSLSVYNEGDLVQEITSRTGTMIGDLDNEFPTSIVLHTFPRVDLIRVNNKNATGLHPLQDLLNKAMLEINDYIVNVFPKNNTIKVNSDYSVST